MTQPGRTTKTSSRFSTPRPHRPCIVVSITRPQRQPPSPPRLSPESDGLPVGSAGCDWSEFRRFGRPSWPCRTCRNLCPPQTKRPTVHSTRRRTIRNFRSPLRFRLLHSVAGEVQSKRIGNSFRSLRIIGNERIAVEGSDLRLPGRLTRRLPRSQSARSRRVRVYGPPRQKSARSV